MIIFPNRFSPAKWKIKMKRYQTVIMEKENLFDVKYRGK